ncbi:hypothetical protein D3C73_102200 [compost metagenome]
MGTTTVCPHICTKLIRCVIHTNILLLTSYEYIFYPVSTAPIITTTKGKLKER